MLEHTLKTPTLPGRTVVIGARGFVGSHIAGRIAAGGGEVLGLGSDRLDLLAADAAGRLAAELKSDDAVVFVSAIAPCKDASSMVKNIKMAESVIDAVQEVPVAHLVYVSSDAVYADDIHPVSESSYAAPASPHGAMHLTREVLLKTGLGGVPLAILRPSLLYGASDPHNGYGPNRFRRQAEKGEQIKLFGEGEEQRDHVLVDDVAHLAELVLSHRSVGVLNAVTGTSTSFRAIAEEVVAIAGQGEVLGTPRQNPITHRHFDVTQRIKAFPQFAPTPLADGLRLAAG